MSRRFIIDTDTASDDAVALLMALYWPDVHVEAITVVSGNVPLAQASINARYTVELSEQAVPVYEGASRPLLRPPAHAEWFHGPDGMGACFYPAPQQPAAGQDAVAQLIERFRAAPGQISLVTLGPLTNIALALRIEPRLADWVKEAFVMGGAACCVGNVTPAAEYNIWVDPEAAQIVFASGMKLLMIGWEHSRGAAALSDDERHQIEQIGTTRARFAMECNEHALRASREIQHAPGLMLADPVAMAVALDPQVCTQRSPHFVEIECQSALTRGMTVVDQLGVRQQPADVEVCWAIDPVRWKRVLCQALGAA
jgi:purine nucleosidase